MVRNDISPAEFANPTVVDEIYLPLLDSLLHTTHRLTSQEYKNGIRQFSVSGPAETPGVVRVYLPNSQRPQVTATAANGEPVKITSQNSKKCISSPRPQSWRASQRQVAFSGPVCYNNTRLNYALMNRGTNPYGQERNYMKGHRYV